MKQIYALRCTEKAAYDRMDGIVGYFENVLDAEDLVSRIKEESLSCDFDVRVETITIGELDKDFISYVIS